jgi:hypothetical protein
MTIKALSDASRRAPYSGGFAVEILLRKVPVHAPQLLFTFFSLVSGIEQRRPKASHTALPP